MKDRKLKKLHDQVEQLGEILAIIPGNVYWKDIEGKYLGCNYTVAKILGLSSPSEIIGKTNYDLMDKELADAATEIDKQAFVNKDGISIEEHGIDEAGNPAIYLSTKIPIINKKKYVTGLVGSSVDITHRKKLEEELQAMKIKAEQANDAKTEFLRNMSHDLRTPFNSILNFCKFLQKTEPNPERKQYLNYMGISAQKLLDIINQIVEVIKLEGSQLPIQSEKFNLREILESIKLLMLPELHEEQLEFKILCADEVPAQLIGDPIRVHRIILNLVSNAIRFTEKGKIVLQVNMMNKHGDHLTLAISVEDTGIGISDDKFDFIFGRFNRVASSYRGAHEGMGMGIGLSIVKQYVDELNGKILLESKIGEGSKFTVILEMKNYMDEN